MLDGVNVGLCEDRPGFKAGYSMQGGVQGVQVRNLLSGNRKSVTGVFLCCVYNINQITKDMPKNRASTGAQRVSANV